MQHFVLASRASKPYGPEQPGALLGHAPVGPASVDLAL